MKLVHCGTKPAWQFQMRCPLLCRMAEKNIQFNESTFMIGAAVFARRMEFVYLFFTCKNSRLTLWQSTHHLSWDWPWHVLVKIKKSRETSRRALNCFVHSFQNLDKTSTAVVTKKSQFEKLSFQQNAFKEWRKCTISSQYDGSGVKMFILFAMRWVDPLTAFRKTTPWHYGEWR